MKTVIASHLPKMAVHSLRQRGIHVFDFFPNMSAGEYVRHHADLSFLYAGNKDLIIAREMAEYKDRFPGYHVFVLTETLSAAYPGDVKLNCVMLGKYLICNIDTVSPFVLQYFKEKGRTVIPVRQGYTKCSVVPVTDNSLITDDESIYDSCKAAGLDVLLVSKGSVKLDGFQYGFIGGASGKISKTEIAFNGDIHTHADCGNILKFLKKYGMSAVSLKDGPLYDIGSMIPLYEEEEM